MVKKGPDINLNTEINPKGEETLEDILFDFPCSDTYRRYEDELLGRESPPETKSLREAKIREYSERIDDAREHRLLTDTPIHTRQHAKIWHEINQLKAENMYLTRKVDRLLSQMQKSYKDCY